MLKGKLTWSWSPPRPPWLVVGAVSTSAILVLGGFLIMMALTHNTRFEQLGFMIFLVLVMIVLAGMIHVLRRNIIRLRLEVVESGLKWIQLNDGTIRRLNWESITRFQSSALRRHGRICGHVFRIWTTHSRMPLVITEDSEDDERYERFRMFDSQLCELLRNRGIPSR
ncbi:MAG: hypothetical protein CMJ29_03060 [Phycisphaerae bacterium]|nr:hypothetical protein [Phycisphaerae bacterium]